jgi:Flp pilus assembly protein TadD
LHLRLGQPDRAEPFLREALRIADATGNAFSRASVLEKLGDMHAMRGQYDLAGRRYRETLAVAGILSDRVVEARVLGSIATALMRSGDRTGARATLVEAQAVADSVGGPLAHDIQRRLDMLAADAITTVDSPRVRPSAG